ncbi:hypothetical protein FQN60_004900 [Etheostoma spectabile]|uniref:VPS26, retromer complex component B n=1 Tax=Etheostoma spectabile TaxID=54343 RepID=A0A5J5DKY2_9PERO|nr:hypothetical protein FQN60_004900 [Etheostoma spectabile]
MVSSVSVLREGSEARTPSRPHRVRAFHSETPAVLLELYYDRGNHHEFVSLVKDLARPGEITQSQTFDFEFTHVEKPYESYTGQNVKLRYFLRATVIRRLNDISKEMDIVVHTLSTYPELNSSIKMEVGIEDCLHIEFEYNKSKYHLKDVIVGKIYFLLVRIKIKHMEIDIIKRETTGTGPSVYHENDTIAKYEIMDGAPVRGNHTVEERRRGEEEHVSSGSHCLSAIRGLGCFRERFGTGGKGGKRVEESHSPPVSSHETPRRPRRRYPSTVQHLVKQRFSL